ncbi:MAG TPA: hypothetical protein VMZ04_02055, partial [Anaerolineae bacterium]|nr:hypothetical protein [Anaerolineae bacterium]
MRSYLKILPLLFFLLVTLICIVGCNIFDFTNDVEKSNIEKAEDAISEGNYAQARKELADAVKDSVDAMALYLNAKTAFLESGVDLSRLVDLIEGQENIASGDKLAILETIDIMDDTEQTTWYRANMEV